MLIRNAETIAIRDGEIVPYSPDDPVTESTIDAEGLSIHPGFIDLQINGGFGNDLASDPSSLWSLGSLLPKHGVTSFLPTIVTAQPGTVEEAIRSLADRPADYRGAEPLGLHLEGPMLNPDRKGAHDEELLREPHRSVVDGWTAAAGVSMVTLAPELPGAVEIIRFLTSNGVVVSGGHSTASFDRAVEANEAGMAMVTHLFNAMEPLHHRSPGLVGYALSDSGVVAGLIADGVHIDPAVVALAHSAKGPSGIALVSDAVAAMGMEPGVHRFGRKPVNADGKSVRFADGTLAGSALTLDQAVRNLVAFTGCDPSDAVTSVTATPAAVLGDDRRGRSTPGATADLTLLRPDLTVAITIGGGQVLHVSEGEEDRISQP